MAGTAHTKALLITPSASRSYRNSRVTFPEKPKSSFHRGIKTNSFCFLFKGVEAALKEAEAAADMIS